METAAVQQAESSISRCRLVASLPTRGMGTQQTSRSTCSPLQPPSAAQEVAPAPCLDLMTAPLRPPVYAWLGPSRDTRSSDWNPSPDGPGPQTFVQHLQRVPLPPRSNGGRGKGKAKHQNQGEGPSTQKGKKNRKDHRRLANSALVATADHVGT